MAYEILCEIEKLLMHGLKTELFEELDLIPMRNAYYAKLNIEKSADQITEMVNTYELKDVLDNILNYAWSKGLLPHNTVTYRDLFDTELMGMMIPRQSVITRQFIKLSQNENIESATTYFYELCKASNYIRTDRIMKNKYWRQMTSFGELEVTINLSKPEKDPAAIAAALNQKAHEYPKCLLCKENVGYHGHVGHPARHNLRVIPVTLGGEKWYYQYSPYLYYNEHAIAFSDKHKPMKINRSTFERLLSFVGQFPHYFAGSNADLPIVGGSILSHDHFQCGKHIFAMNEARVLSSFYASDYPDVQIQLLKWPLSVVRLRSEKKASLIELGNMIFKAWQSYDDRDLEIVSYSIENGQSIPHNTVTPIARFNNGYFELDLVLRNNRKDTLRPFGIFHPDETLHHIKKENIGLIEVMGLAILPGRLNDEIEEIAKILISFESNECDSWILPDQLQKHQSWMKELKERILPEMTYEMVLNMIQESIGEKYLEVLSAAGVFKQNGKGIKGFEKFMKIIGMSHESNGGADVRIN